MSKEAGGPNDVHSMILQLQHMILTLRNEHGVSCAVLGKDGRVVAFKRGADEMEEVKTANDRFAVPTHTRGGRRLLSLGSLVGHEHSDVVLKVNQGSVGYLYASSGTSFECVCTYN